MKKEEVQEIATKRVNDIITKLIVGGGLAEDMKDTDSLCELEL